MKLAVSITFLVLGCALVVAGVARVYEPAAVILSGALLVVAALRIDT